MSGRLIGSELFSWFFWAILLVIGILNIVLIHPVPGIIYIILSFIYFPNTNEFLKQKFRFSILPVVKVVLAILIMWFTLGVGDLMELFEAKYL